MDSFVKQLQYLHFMFLILLPFSDISYFLGLFPVYVKNQQINRKTICDRYRTVLSYQHMSKNINVDKIKLIFIVLVLRTKSVFER
jgi:hypothetical protein